MPTTGPFALGAALTALVFLAAPWAHPADPGDGLVRDTVRVSLAFYAAAAALMLTLRGPGWRAATSAGRLARACWTVAWAVYLVHVAVAFHHAFGWSHAAAGRHTEERSGFGPGIFVSHLFGLAWTADVLWWWLTPERYAARPAWAGWLLHGFMAFVIFNGTVVYETGPIRWAGAAAFALLGCLWLGTRLYHGVSPGPAAPHERTTP